MKNNNLPQRKSPRAQWHNYDGAEYFVTICTRSREHYFGEIKNAAIKLSDIGEYAKQCIEKIEEINKDVQVPLYVVMPNHIHMIIIINNNVEITPSVGLSYHSSCTTLRLPQCDSPTMCGNTTIYDSPTACVNPTTSRDGNQTTINQKEMNLEMQRRANRCGRLSHIIGGFKSAISRYARQNDHSFAWQPRYHDHIIRNQDEKNKIALYIENNIAKWNEDCFFEKTSM
ncbi:MAG: hypothetical protein J6V74_02970 [Bacteroidales bacterium]|nr:hypothetical protein [Bacteroidales bacterium]